MLTNNPSPLPALEAEDKEHLICTCMYMGTNTVILPGTAGLLRSLHLSDYIRAFNYLGTRPKDYRDKQEPLFVIAAAYILGPNIR